MSAFGTFGGLGSTTTTQQPQQQPTASLFGGDAFGANPAGAANPAQNATNTNPLFGGTAAPQNTGATGTGLFGIATPGANPVVTGTGLLGTAPVGQQQQVGGGFLGGTLGQQPTGAGLFGTTNSAGQATTGTTGLFGTTAGGGATGGGLFGTTPNAPASTGTGLFGGANTNATNQPAAATGGLFASNAPGGGLFGSTNATTNAPGLFGTNTATANTGGGLFGTSTNTGTTNLFGQTQNQARPANSLFGAPAQGSNPLFVQSQQQQPQQNTLFGQQQPQQQQQGPLFGSLGQSSAPGAGTLFGTGNLGASNLGGSSLSNTTVNLYGSRTPATQTLQPDAHSQFIAILQRIEAIKLAWDASSPQCRFQVRSITNIGRATNSYWRFSTSSTTSWTPRRCICMGARQTLSMTLLGRRPCGRTQIRAGTCPVSPAVLASHAHSALISLVPVLAVGMDDLQQRVDAQTKQAAEHQEKLKVRIPNPKTLISSYLIS